MIDETRWEAWLRPQTTAQGQTTTDGNINVDDDRIGTALSTRSARKRIISSTSAVGYDSCFVMLSLRLLIAVIDHSWMTFPVLSCPVLTDSSLCIARTVPVNSMTMTMTMMN